MQLIIHIPVWLLVLAQLVSGLALISLGCVLSFACIALFNVVMAMRVLPYTELTASEKCEVLSIIVEARKRKAGNELRVE